MQSTVKWAIQVLSKYYIDPIDSSVDLLHLLSELIGTVDDQVSWPLVVKYSQNTNVPLQTLKDNFDSRKRTEVEAGPEYMVRWIFSAYVILHTDVV